MIFQPRKAALYKLAIEHGVSRPEEILQYLPLGSSVPQARLDGWLQQLFRLPKSFSSRRRYVNRFKLGADPEFVFGNTQLDEFGRTIGSTRINSADLGFAQGPAFGADNNGRLAEIRPYPSRSAVEVVASILCTLRWMALAYPQTLKYEWLSGAFIWEDGLGGHVHFGRKRPTRKEEVAALDQIEEGLVHLGAYSKDQVTRRRQGDARRQIYGALGDYRLQAHGYEYRTFPSWLDSPELAFFTLVVAKLAVQVPSLYCFKGASTETERARLRNFLAYFKGVDDDARLALMLLDRGIPQYQKGNFAPRWGIANVPKKTLHPPIIPPCIRPDTQSVEEVFEYLLNGKPLTFRIPEITWSPTKPLQDYQMCLPDTNTIQAKGLGEMIWDLCYHRERPVYFMAGRHQGMDYPLVVSRDLSPVSDRKEQGIRVITVGELCAGQISIAPEWREGQFAPRVRRALLSGAFPVWSVKTCKDDSYKLWQEQTKRGPRKFAGTVVYESSKIPL